MKARILLTVLAGLLASSISYGQYFPYGKNRVQYEDFEWRYLQSKHFDVYYYGSKNYKLAEFASMSVESAYKQLKDDFDHELSDRISVIIYDSHNDFSQTNVVNLPSSAEGIGGVTDKYKNRMTIPFDGEYSDFRRTIHHELVHAVFNDMFYGGSLNSIIQNNIQLVFPLWFEEGLAEYTALGWDTNTDMFVRDAVINNYLPPLRYLSGYYAYRGGQSFWNYIVEEYGREKIAEILQSIKTSRSLEYGLTTSLGMNIEDLSKAWTEALKKRYYPEVAERQRADALATLLTKRGDFGTYNTSAAISPQGDKVAFITNSRGYFDVVVISTINGRKLKTLIRGEDNPDFEELNILNPNLAWSPDGSKVALSTKTKGRDDIAIIDYNTKNIEKLKFPSIDAIGSVSWSPDGSKIAFDGNIGPFQDIFIYDLSSKELNNLTKDIYSDREPAWSEDSKSVFFVSDRGESVALGETLTSYSLFKNNGIYQTDIYRVSIGANTASQITDTPLWNEFQPITTRTGKVLFISDENGIQNLKELDLRTRTTTPVTDLQSGVSQISISADGSKLAFNSINSGYLDIFLLKSPLNRKVEKTITDNYWAKRRADETQAQRVPATKYAQSLFEEGVVSISEVEVKEKTQSDSLSNEEQDGSNIDFRNYVFADDVIQDSTIYLKDVEAFTIENNLTEDGRYVPQEYRLKFDVDIAYSPTFVASTYGSYALTQFIISDLLGDHQIALGTNFVFDLRESDYSFQYGNLKNRTNYFANYFHTSRRYQNIFGELIRYRTYGLGATVQYPFDKFRRIDFNFTLLNVDLDFNSVTDRTNNSVADRSESSRFIYPEVVYTDDKTKPGFITPTGGYRYSVGLSGSPVIGSTAPEFASVLGDFRKYIDLGSRYTFALRFSTGLSVGKDAQNYFLGGKLGWLNQQYSANGFSADRITDNFFTVPALPLRGFEYNSINGNNFSLINAEFRFPLFAAIVPGAIPILPLYNITGLAFLDAGTAWGQRIDYNLRINRDSSPDAELAVNGKELDFTVAKERIGYTYNPQNNSFSEFTYLDGDVLIGGGFGLRSILFGLPFGYDIGWAYDRTGFKSDPVHYFSIGIDF
ncbi:MAG: PD40 domain-containing protein [Balneola sp.]|nr:PD40 domain-containing protein [Balneola sp.]MBO6651588.1 PD40 domain-containing protein [Balneola sp.]MBO6710941.1 PD40 domain-containing protein [Balneola sp.]MBO6799628.1 PD40 domain-containing protein [Balneola sp.]MBO6870361.1 PD40 domain-containing protein [Balneola sp.]